MKKAIAYILVLCTLAFAVPCSRAEQTEDFSEYEEFAVALKIMPQPFAGAENITRGEFADYLCNILYNGGEEKVTQWIEKTFEDDNSGTLMYPSKDTGVFDDVSKNHVYYDSISRVRNMLIMKGTGNTVFSPDKNITYREAATAMVRLLGYGVYAKDGEWCGIADSLGIFDGISYSPDEFVDKNHAAKIFYNCMDIELMGISFSDSTPVYEVEEESNIYAKFMNVYCKKGQIIKNRYTSIYGDEGAGKDRIVIDTGVYGTEGVPYADDYIGRNVRFYFRYDEEKDDIPKVLLLVPDKKDDAVKIEADDFESFADLKFTYLKNDKSITKKIAPGAALIYNGLYKAAYTESDFAFENGDITIIRPNGAAEYETIIVNNYATYYITEVSEISKKVYAKKTQQSEVKCFELADSNADDFFVNYRLADETKADFSALAKGKIIDVLENGKYLTFVVSDEQISDFYITGISYDDDKVFLEDAEGTVYEVDRGYYESLGYMKPTVKSHVNLKFNSFSKIAYIEKANLKNGKSLVYIIKNIASENDENIGYIKYLGTDNTIKTAETAQGAAATLADNRKLKFTESEKFLQYVNEGYTGVAEIELNDESKISRISIPQKDNGDRNCRLGLMAKIAKAIWCGLPSKKHFENVVPSGDVVIFNIDNDAQAEKDKYRVIKQSVFADGSGYDIEAYNYDSESVLADCIVVNNKVSSSIEQSTNNLYVVDKIYEGVNDDNESVTKIEAYRVSVTGDAEKTEFIDEESKLSEAETFFDENAKMHVRKGDVLFLESENGKITRAVVLYRLFNEDKTPMCALAGSSGVYDPQNGAATNPFKLNSQGKPDTNEVNVLRNSPARFFAGVAYRTENGEYLTYTSQPLDKGYAFDKKNLDTKYLTETVVLPQKYVVVNIKNKNFELKNATSDDIRTYKNSGTECSKLFVLTRYAAVRQLIVVNIEK